MPTDDLPAPIAEGSYEWYRREVERLRGELATREAAVAEYQRQIGYLAADVKQAEAERDTFADTIEQIPDSHVKLGEVAQSGGDQCVPWCPKCRQERADELEAERDAILRHDKEAVQQLNAAEAELTATREQRDALKAAIEQVCGRLDWLIANGFGARTADLVDLRAALDTPSAPESTTEPHEICGDERPWWFNDDKPVRCTLPKGHAAHRAAGYGASWEYLRDEDELPGGADSHQEDA